MIDAERVVESPLTLPVLMSLVYTPLPFPPLLELPELRNKSEWLALTNAGVLIGSVGLPAGCEIDIRWEWPGLLERVEDESLRRENPL